MFRILAVEILEPDEELKSLLNLNRLYLTDEQKLRVDRYHSVHKVLKPGIFRFYRDVDINSDGIINCKGNNLKGFFNDKNDNVPPLTISAIVGENGMGKSTLVSVVMRLINNLAMALKDGLEQEYAKGLSFVSEVFARLYVEDVEDGTYYAITQQNKKLSVKIHDQEKTWQFPEDFKFKENRATQNIKKCRDLLSEMFYTIVLDYSNYAFWTTDYHYEWMTKSEGESLGIEMPNDTCWLDALFHKNDAYQTPIVLNPYRDEGQIEYQNERELLLDRVFHMVLNKKVPVSSILNGKFVDGVAYNLREELLPKRNTLFDSPMVRNVIKENRIFPSATTDELMKMCKNIILCWEHFLGDDYDFLSEISTTHADTDRYNWNEIRKLQALNYIVYKTLKIVYKYEQYKQYQGALVEGQVGSLIADMYNDDSHITQKIRRCLTYLITSVNGPSKIMEDKTLLGYTNVRELTDEIKKHVRALNKKENLRKKTQNTRAHKWTSEDFWPAPCFKLDLLLKTNSKKRIKKQYTEIEIAGDSYIPFSSLSSGEQHLINLAAAMLYHIQNVASRWLAPDKSGIQYKNICIIVDEAELYAHPKYQQEMISYIRKSLGGLYYGKEKVIKGLHIIFATHSPFVLSDIPANNILCMQNGESLNSKLSIDGTFGANIYDLLQQKFFLESGMGEFAQERVSAIINMYQKVIVEGQSRHSLEKLRKEFEQNKEKFDTTISILGDVYLKKSLSGMKDEMSDIFKEIQQ